MSGVLEGGWEYVWLAYGASAVAFLGYTVSVLLRYREERQRRARDAVRPPGAA